MKLTQIVIAGTLAALSLAAHAQDLPGMKMDDMNMNGMQMNQEAQQVQQASGEGTIKAIDTAKQRVTIAHGAVPAVQWPSMTMAFAATAEQLAGLAIGDRVTFAFRLDGGAATIVSIRK
ncbi:putative copper efflux system periplasmic protein CusF [Pseudomonas chlororaphis]|uniref:copper-binding protein n=1 Tax=Pseudomonas chlororaphis TaxID=587753 RepID=UPI000F56C274|nr:copper-binding protein [Pseudomonas chlororaphis]AZD08051.1 putative copper efflux system periplasmic protein CusF [Pseudomonas chlororaphis]